MNQNNRPLGWTTLEESKQLVEMGLPVETADMFWAPDADTVVPTSYINKTEHETLVPAYKGAMPCWSLGALVPLLPLSIQTGESFLDKYYLDFRIFEETESKLYMVTYCIKTSWHGVINTEKHGTLIEACIDMLCWLLKNNYIK